MTKISTSPSPKVYGWCPGALRPMRSGDGLVVRIRTPLGRLSQSQAQSVAALSQTHGNGRVDLSARANLQLRGISDESYPLLIEGLRQLGFIDANTEAEARRNLLLTPFWSEGDDSHVIASDLARKLAEASDLILPGKFGFAVDCGAAPVLSDTAADIRLERAEGGILLRADGAETGLVVSRETAAEAAISLARWFLNQGGASDGRGRMQSLIARRGPPAAHAVGRSSLAPKPRLGNTFKGQLVGLEFGQIRAEELAKLAQSAPLRLTPWRMLLLEGARDLAPRPGLILDATDPRLQVSACTGAPGCLQAHASLRDLARDLAPALPEGSHLHVSGCSKGCAHPAPADHVLTATGPDTFDLIHHGTAADQPVRETLTAAALRANPTLLTEGS